MKQIGRRPWWFWHREGADALSNSSDHSTLLKHARAEWTLFQEFKISHDGLYKQIERKWGRLQGTLNEGSML